LVFVVGLIVFMLLPALSAGLQDIAAYYVQFFFAPPALFVFLLAGLLAPRSGYLIGMALGLFAAVLWSVALLTLGTSTSNPAAEPISTDNVALLLNLVAIGLIYGLIFASIGRFLRRLVDPKSRS